LFEESDISCELLAALLNKQQTNKSNMITLGRRHAGRIALGSELISWRVEEIHEFKNMSTNLPGAL
jgi:hypothetical protein